MGVGGPRPYERDIRHVRKGMHPMPRRPQQPRGGPPGPAVDRYKSQSRSLSEENTGERASSAGSPRAAPAAGSPAIAAADKTAAATEKDVGGASAGGENKERGPSGSPERAPPSSLPLHSRLGDLRRRLQSKRAEPAAQQQ
ncbi:hypothetical protein, conserved [Eimeria praecox]|uniref:Uncharacterized protein n=1 Tax=Eimeria praecox TaxID=51316 RepID=U6GXY0_9EIME|nr:hypothetical protein, conserved [Eimeria praecox]